MAIGNILLSVFRNYVLSNKFSVLRRKSRSRWLHYRTRCSIPLFNKFQGSIFFGFMKSGKGSKKNEKDQNVQVE